ncbi:hypothetical protein CJ030_MR5G023520 [Morella rubra]|uniref:Uncharacterized protein n=1 Tax=Morella rubra TaxID=262757 RepID=A0A6A1VL39_9ROSI|nr:hypothetical protein CJ030_MR5G023520 [Morella rubra]
MSSSRPTRSSQRTPASVGSKGKKKARTTEEPTPTPEDYIYKSGLCKNRFVQDFQNRKVIAGRWADFQWFSENEFGFQEMFEFQGWGILVNLKLCEWKMLDLSSSSLNSMVNAPNAGKKFFENHGWVGLSEVDPLHILRVVLDNPTLDEIIKPTASDLSIPTNFTSYGLQHYFTKDGKFEYITFLDLFVMYCLITRTPMNLGQLMINHMKAATEKKRQGLPYGMFFTHMFHILDIDLGGEVRETPKASKEYNQKTLRLMGFTQNVKVFG